MRGQKAFNELTKGPAPERPATKGRNHGLLTKRNECLLARYYYYCYFKNKCYEEIIRTLAGEYFLSPATVSNIIVDYLEDIRLLKRKAPSLYYFQNMWPFMKW